MPISDPYQPSLSGLLISLQEARPASPTVLPESGSENPTPGICGPNTYGSSESSDLVGLSLRTCLVSALQRLTGLSLTWNQKVTPSGRSWWVLGRSVHHTKGKGSGSLPDDGWLTPKASDGRPKGVGGSDPSKGLIFQAREWPTPNRMDGDRGPEKQSVKDARGSGGTALPGAAMWGTPRAAASEGMGNPCRANDSRLEDQAQPWPSPQANDEKNLGNATPGHSHQLWHLPGPLGAEPSNTLGKPRESCVLNGAWVLQLMGFPSDWCDLPQEYQVAEILGPKNGSSETKSELKDAPTAPHFVPPGTLSSHRSRRKSCGR